MTQTTLSPLTRPTPTHTTSVTADPALEQVLQFFKAKPYFSDLLGKALRHAFDEVIDGRRTGRFRIEDLEKTEKTYIGTKVEIVIRNELELQRGAKLDNLISGHEVDTKFSLKGQWMIPEEATDEICLVIAGSDATGTYSAGLIRTKEEVLRPKKNRDGKRGVSAVGKRHIQWIVEDGPLPRNFLLDLEPAIRTEILSQNSGTQRLAALFTMVPNQIIPRSVVVQVAQLQGDPLRRARNLKDSLARVGIQVLCAKYASDREKFREYGFPNFVKDDWLSIRS